VLAWEQFRKFACSCAMFSALLFGSGLSPTKGGSATASTRSAVCIGPGTFFGLESRAPIEEPLLIESIATTNGSLAHFLLNGLSWRT
jgi:hypothetical protein